MSNETKVAFDDDNGVSWLLSVRQGKCILSGFDSNAPDEMVLSAKKARFLAKLLVDEFPSEKPDQVESDDPVADALELIAEYGTVDGDSHKQWLLDQVVRILAGDGYEEWIRSLSDGLEEDDAPIEWDEGIAP